MTKQEVEAINESYTDQFPKEDDAPNIPQPQPTSQDVDCNCSKAFGLPYNC